MQVNLAPCVFSCLLIKTAIKKKKKNLTTDKNILQVKQRR